MLSKSECCQTVVTSNDFIDADEYVQLKGQYEQLRKEHDVLKRKYEQIHLDNLERVKKRKCC